MTTDIAESLAAVARAAHHALNEGQSARTPEDGPAPVVLADRPDGTVVACGRAVAKAHPPDDSSPGRPPTGVQQLGRRLAVAAHPRLAGVLLPPLATASAAPRPLPGGRLATCWPRGAPVDPAAPEAAPWEPAGRLLARLHAVPLPALQRALPGPLPAMRGPAKAAAAIRRMRATAHSGAEALPPGLAAAARAAERAWDRLPAWCRAEAPAPQPGVLCHGDFHLGQLVRHPVPGGGWQLIDVDDLGLGDAAWDLARPAAWYAAGVLPPADWEVFLGAYQEAAVGYRFDPWPRLDAPARALAVQTAALAVAKAHAARRPLNDAENACVEACVRMARTGAVGP